MRTALRGTSPTAPGDAERPLLRLRELRQASATMRRVRWFGAAFVLIQFTLYRPPEGLTLPFPRLPATLLVLALVVAVNLVSLASRRVRDADVLARIGVTELTADAGIVLAVVWMFSFDTTSALWALLVIPVLEGAVRGQLTGALATWGFVAVGYLVRDLWASTRYSYATFLPESVTYRMGIVLIVAITAGLLARNLTRAVGDLHVQVRAHREAQRESERRAELLQVVAGAGRHMTSLDLDHLLAIVVDSVVEIGFDAAAICVLSDDRAGFTVPHTSGLPFGDCDHRHDVAGVVELALRKGDTVTVSEPLPWFDLDTEVSFEGSLVTPVWCGDDLAAVLIGGVAERRGMPLQVRESFELLAAQAGAAMVNARRYAERRSFQAELEHQAFHDALTGLPNRAAFLDRLDKAMAPLALDEDGDGLVAVLFCDLDRFKIINDTLGHDVGDTLLQGVAERLRGCVRGEDMVARLGGDEFTVLLSNLDDEEDAARVARRIIHAMARPVPVDDGTLDVTTSVGIAFGLRGRNQARDLLRAADLAMYRAKEEGRDRYAMTSADAMEELDLHVAAREVIL